MDHQLVTTMIKPALREMAAYHVQDAAGMIKLDAMENPYALSEELRTAWLKFVKPAALNRYPDGDAAALKSQVQKLMQVDTRHAVLLGNGSDELIQIIMLACAFNQRAVIAVEPSFVMYRLIAAMVGVTYRGVPLNADFSLPVAGLQEAMVAHAGALVFIASPNNPTGNLFEAQALEQIIAASDGLVIIDEAYFPFAKVSLQAWMSRYPQLLVLRTLSKMGLAGLRLGMLFGQAELIAEFNKARLPYNINILTQKSLEFVFEYWGVFNQQVEHVIHEREQLLKQLSVLPGLQVYPSKANFILFKSLVLPAAQIFNHLLQKKILIKMMKSDNELLVNCLRMTVGLPEENKKFLAAMKQILTP